MTRQQRWIKFAAYAAVVILINMAASTLFFRLDLTGNRVYSLSTASRDAVGRFDGEGLFFR